MKKRKIIFISGARADYGLMRETLLKIKNHKKLEIEIVATGIHLMPKFGMTVNEIKKDRFKIHELKAVYQEDSKYSMAKFIGKFIQLLIEKIRKARPDMILLLGDRAEMLAAAVVGAYLNISVAHIHGGERSASIDESARHAITKLSHIHLAATENSAHRIIKMGEDKSRVFIVGAPGLDSILNDKRIPPKEMAKKYDIDLSQPVILLIQHPVTTEDSGRHIKETMEAVKELGLKTIVIYPNADTGGRKMIEVIERYRKYPFIKIYKNISHKDYLSLMAIASVIAGNSSGGLIEAPSFKLPAINIGNRQEGRERTINVIDVGYKKDEIKKAIKKAIYDKKLLKRLTRCKNPYGDGKTGARIADILSKILIDKKLIQKKISY